jgi:hypothetical protein
MAQAAAPLIVTALSLFIAGAVSFLKLPDKLFPLAVEFLNVAVRKSSKGLAERNPPLFPLPVNLVAAHIRSNP